MNDNAMGPCPGVLVDEADEPPPVASTVYRPARSADGPDAGTLVQWGDWKWQLRNRARDLHGLREMLPDLRISPDALSACQRFPLAITPYYASLIRNADPSDPVYAQAVPQGSELNDPPCLMDDPLEEDHDMPVPGLVHRYGDRALVLATSMCAMYCRHCTRKRVAGQRETQISRIDLVRIVDYLGSHPEITDVIVSGGDPLALPTAALDRVLTAIRSVPSVEIIRIGTRTPVVLPMRITSELVRMLRKHHPLFINTHFNHPRELTVESRVALARLADAGIPLGNQSVLLRGVNDHPLVLEELFRGLVRSRVRPYYLFQCDLVRGVEHFRTPISRGIEIMECLRGRLSGLAIPSYIVDTPHGGGKVPLLPNYLVSMSPTHTVLRNHEGILVSYPEPTLPATPPVSMPPLDGTPGVWELACGQVDQIAPATDRHARRVMGSTSRRIPMPDLQGI